MSHSPDSQPSSSVDDDSELDVSELSEPVRVRLFPLLPLHPVLVNCSELSLLFSEAIDTMDAQFDGGGEAVGGSIGITAPAFILWW